MSGVAAAPMTADSCREAARAWLDKTDCQWRWRDEARATLWLFVQAKRASEKQRRVWRRLHSWCSDLVEVEAEAIWKECQE